jgi:serine protease
MAPRVLERDIKESGVRVDREALRAARQTAEQSIKADTESAQIIGDEVARKAADAEAPVPKALAVRSKLNVDRALVARERAYSKLEQLGLSGVVTPEEGGQMRITIAVKPTQGRLDKDLTAVPTMRDLFAPARPAEQTCEGDPSAEQMQQDAVLATECVVKLLQETGEYEYVEKDYIFSNQMLRKPKAKPATATGMRPNDPLFGLQWHFKDNGAAAGQSAGGAGFSNFWTRARLTGSRNVTVAVIDTGLQMNHPDIVGSRNLAPGFDMVSDPMMGNDGDGRDADPNDPGDRCDPSDPASRDTFHGTHVAGTIGVAATNNSSGVAGGAWDVTIVPVRALGRCGGRLSDINDAIRWAAGRVPARDAQGEEVWNRNPADIINLSIGLFEPCPASMQAAIDDAVAAGAIVVAAAGNARVDTKYFAPGGCRNVISVAAGDARGLLTPYSNFGDNVAIMAPGGDMTRDDDGDGRPDGVLSTKFSTDCYDPAKPDVQVAQCYYAYENGTSMAAPHVAAALALLKAKFPSAVPSDLRARLLAASTARAPLQCAGKCSNYPGTSPIPGQDGMCFRPCGGAMLNLANAAVQ